MKISFILITDVQILNRTETQSIKRAYETPTFAMGSLKTIQLNIWTIRRLDLTLQCKENESKKIKTFCRRDVEKDDFYLTIYYDVYARKYYHH